MKRLIRDRIKSFGYAFRGLRWALEQPNFLIHLTVAFLVLILSWHMDISRVEFCLVAILIGLTLALEIFNTAIEYLCDRVTSDHETIIMKVKDLSAAAVLVVAFVDVIVGIVIFWPYLISLVSG